MTREKFIAKAVRAAEVSAKVPTGWWGNWRNVYGPNGAVVRFSGQAWVVRLKGELVSRHDSREAAIRKAVRL